MVSEKRTFKKPRYLKQWIERLTLNPNVNWKGHKGRCSFLSFYVGGLLSLIPLPLEPLYFEIYLSLGSKHKKTTFHYRQSGWQMAMSDNPLIIDKLEQACDDQRQCFSMLKLFVTLFFFGTNHVMDL